MAGLGPLIPVAMRVLPVAGVCGDDISDTLLGFCKPREP